MLFTDVFRRKVDYDILLKTERLEDNKAKFATKELSKFIMNRNQFIDKVVWYGYLNKISGKNQKSSEKQKPSAII